ncbi:DUF4190 domain-containing protein [Micromonospora sp. NPDC047074]|uniref:DUF4190 domain-containing protein n=1 Tax=Micromonospora sp. NPDC047074 TaxID=3154339 RepID=UPI0033C011F4
MTYPPPSGGWNDPAWSGQQSSPPADPALPVSGQPIPTQPAGADPYAPADPYAVPDPYAVADPYAGMKQPPGQPVGYPPQAYPGYGYPPVQKTNGMAIAALVLALVGIGSCITAPIGAILGHVAQKQIRETGEGGEGMAKAGIIVGWIVTGLYALVMICYVGAIIFAITQSDTSSSSY